MGSPERDLIAELVEQSLVFSCDRQLTAILRVPDSDADEQICSRYSMRDARGHLIIVSMKYLLLLSYSVLVTVCYCINYCKMVNFEVRVKCIQFRRYLLGKACVVGASTLRFKLTESSSKGGDRGTYDASPYESSE